MKPSLVTLRLGLIAASSLWLGAVLAQTNAQTNIQTNAQTNTQANAPVPSPASAAPFPTYSADIQPIMQANCAGCHRSGGIAPFALQTYDDAASKAPLIAAVTGERRMPPWMPGGKTPPLKYARTLTDAQIEQIAAWVSGGARP